MLVKQGKNNDCFSFKDKIKVSLTFDFFLKLMTIQVFENHCPSPLYME